MAQKFHHKTVNY